MTAAPDARSTSRIKRKPPPAAFPYSPRYPHPDPTDPFASLQALRERAHSSQKFGGSNASTSSLTHTPPIPPDSGRQTNHLFADLPPLPRTVLHAARSIDAIDHLRNGYHSDVSGPPRPLRARTRPSRDSTAYFSDADLAATQPQPRHHNLDHGSSEQLADRQYQHRRRSQTISIFPVTPAQPTSRGLTQEVTTAVQPDSHPSAQYVYGDRQSHGHMYGRGGAHGEPSGPASADRDHLHQPNVPTPPMTPDDTLTSSSVSVHDRLGSISPETVLEDPPSPPPPPKHPASDSDAGQAVPDVTVVSRGIAVRDLSRIRTSDIPAVPGKTEPDSPAPLPVPPPRPRLPRHAESEPAPELASKRLSIVADRKDSLTRRFRRSSLYARDRKVSDPPPPARTRRLHNHDPVIDSPSHDALLAGRQEREAGPNHSYDASHVLLVSGVDGPSKSKERAKVSHRKSLSHVSLGITPLPNVMIGPSPSLAENDLPPLPQLPNHAPQPTVPQPHVQAQRSQPPVFATTLARALDLTPLPTKDAPLPPNRKDSRLPTPPREERSTRDSHASQAAPSAEPSYSRPRRQDNIRRTPDSDVVLLRPSQFATYEYDQSSPSPPLSSNMLLSRPTSTFSPLPPPVTVASESPSPLPPQYPISTNNYSPLPPQTGTTTRRAPSPPPALRHPSPVNQPRRAPSPVYQPRRAPSPVYQPRRTPSPVAAIRREPSPLPVTRHTPTPPPAPRRAPSPLPPRQDEPPTPAPLPLSPPSRIDHDLPTPLPQPPLPQPPRAVPVYLNDLPRGFSAVEATEPSEPPVSRRAVSPSYGRESARTFLQESTRPRTPDTRYEQSRRSEELEERSALAYTSGSGGSNVQTLQQPPASANAAGNSRPEASTSPYNSVRQHNATRRTIHGQVHAQTQYSHLPFRSETSPPADHVTTRAQTAEHITAVPRAQSPTHLPSGRAQSPSPVVNSNRVQSPLPSTRVQSPPVTTSSAPTRIPPPPPPPPSSYSHPHTQARSRMRSQQYSVDHDEEVRTEESARHMNSASQSTMASAQVPRVYATSTESTPLPLPETPSTTFSHPYRSHGAGRPSRNTRSGSVPARPGESRRHHRRKEEPSFATFDEHAGLTRDQIARAASLTVIAQNGLRVQFGELFKDRKTIIIFIRHFWCPMCQDYMYSISRNVDYESLKRAGYDFVIIGNGSHGMIKSYRHIFRTPIPMYTDPTLRLHAALGMTLRTTNQGPDIEKGDYIRHGAIGGIAMVVRNALRVGMPVWEKGGDAMQLGGEFVMGSGLNCSFAHRMTTTRSHASILDVLMAAGYHFSIPTAPDGAPSLSPEEEEAWMEERRRSLARMRARREKRRVIGPTGPHSDDAHLYEPELGYDSDSRSVSARGSWTSSVEKREMAALVAERQRERERERKRKGPAAKKTDGMLEAAKGLGLHVANPDEQFARYDQRDREHDRNRECERQQPRKHHNSNHVHVAQEETTPEWNSASVPLSYIDDLGRRADGYDITEEEGTPAFSYRHD